MELKPKEQLNKKYLIHSKIGQGCFGVVYKGIQFDKKKYVAIKQVFKKKFSMPKVKELFNSEVNILYKVKNENVVGFIDYFDNEDSCFLIQEYCNSGDLEQLLKIRKHIPEIEAIAMFKQLINGFRGLHEIRAVHRDLKAANILIHDQSILKIADLGFGKILREGDITSTVLGTSLTMAPEVLEQKKYSLEVDLYSLGVIFYQILFGVFPFYGKDDKNLLNNIKNLELNLEPNSVKISSNMKSLLRGMLCYSREKRMKWSQLYQHSIFADKINTQQSGFAQQSSKIVLTGLEKVYVEYEEGLNVAQSPFDFDIIVPKNEMPLDRASKQEIDIQSIIIETEKNQIKQDNILKIAKIYIHQSNVYRQLIQTIKQAMKLPEMRINSYIPIFLIQKKVFNMNQLLCFTLEKSQNIYKLEYFDSFLKSSSFQDFFKTIKEEEGIITQYYENLRIDASDMLSRMTNQNQRLIKEVKEPKIQDGWEQLYKERLVNYYQSLENERPNFQKEEQIKIFKHQWCVLDAIVIDRYSNQLSFDFDNQYKELSNTPFKDFEQVVSEKFYSIL